MNLITWFAKNPIAANLLMVVILAGGISSAVVVDKWLYPPTALDTIEIKLNYPGASPGEVEQGLCIPIEEALKNLSGVKKITCKAGFAYCVVTVEVAPGYPTDQLLLEAKLEIDAIETFPEQMEDLAIKANYAEFFALKLMLHGQTDVLTLKRLQAKVQEDLLKLPEVARAEAYPPHSFEISVEVPEETLRRYDLSFKEIAEVINAASFNLPSGEIYAPESDYVLRSRHQAYTEQALAAITLRDSADGSQLRLGDIAKIHDGLAWQPPILSRFDGEPAVSLDVYPTDSLTATVEAVRAYIKNLRPQLPAGIQITPWDDGSRYLKARLGMLLEDALGSFLIVYLILFLFLRAQLALWTGIDIAVAFMGALWLMPYLGLSFNMYTLTAFILVLGIVVDDAIVIAENIYEHQDRGTPPLKAALEGTREMAPLVILMVLMPVIALLPALFLPGVGGRLLFEVAAVIILALLFSLADALLILPAHLASGPGRSAASLGRWKGWRPDAKARPTGFTRGH